MQKIAFGPDCRADNFFHTMLGAKRNFELAICSIVIEGFG